MTSMSSLSSVIPSHLLPSKFSKDFFRAMTDNQHINVIGAGIGGLSVGQALRRHGMSVTLYQRSHELPRHSYGMTLHASTFDPLAKMLGMSPLDLRSRLAVDSAIGGRGIIAGLESTDAFRANRWKLETLLAENLDIVYGSAAEGATETAEGVGVQLHGDEKPKSGIFVIADGVHSTVRKSLLPEISPKILPVVAFNGRRQVSPSQFEEELKTPMQNSTILELNVAEVLLRVYVNDMSDTQVSIGWTYSRRPRTAEDPLHAPNRPNAGAKDIPEAFYTEVCQLKGLPQPFRTIFDPIEIRKDRVLHWLMRTTSVPEDNLVRLAEKNVFFIGDAVHAQPIIGGNGANEAIIDGLQLADALTKGGVEEARRWYRSRLSEWNPEVEQSEQRIMEMHVA